ncbi:serine protease [Streptomyces diacarni]|uniref:Serine protease n=1 Tax=Streptomyces diacarni TaxID=2800381 RepID=A0A367F2V6_9ACTN|nr:trypsin-like peptidase domain-containing protein [Streptomyces diacarni]RCG24704.1 serine protease [Streptomyces diacarni]
MSEARLAELATLATVRIGPVQDPRALWGSGFFVAPGWVLTCYHVLEERLPPEGDGRLLVQGPKHRCAAKLAYRPWTEPVDGTGAGPEHDLALVRLLEDIDHPCVWLTDRSDPPGRLRLYGWRVGDGGQPRSWSGHCHSNGTDSDHGITLGSLHSIPHGASGGPVVDQDYGAVVGVVKARRRHGDGGLAIRSTALRGFARAVPVAGETALGEDPFRELMRRHDHWHGQRSAAASWARAQEELGSAEAERSWRPDDTLAALARVSALPPPADRGLVPRMIEEALGGEEIWLEEPGDWREGHGRLRERLQGRSHPAEDVVFLHYLWLVSQVHRDAAPEESEGLERFVRHRSSELGPKGRSVPDSAYLPDALRSAMAAPRAAVPGQDAAALVVELDPDHYARGRFHWRVWAWDAGVDSPRLWAEEESGEGATLEELPHRLSAPLSNAFTWTDHGSARARLEFAVPTEHFDLDVHLWRSRLVARSLRPHPADDHPFGVHRQVVLRDLHRRGAPAPEWQQRWSLTEGEQLEALPLVSLANRQLEHASAGAVPLLCRPAAQSAGPLGQVLRAGHGVVLWHRTAHHAYGCDEACERFRAETAAMLRGLSGVAVLPEEVRLLRERVSKDDARAAWAEDLALLYDDPRRPIPEPTDRVSSP